MRKLWVIYGVWKSSIVGTIEKFGYRYNWFLDILKKTKIFFNGNLMPYS